MSQSKQTSAPEDWLCAGCRHDVPEIAGCRAATWGEDGYLHLPEGYCYESGTPHDVGQENPTLQQEAEAL